MRAHHQRAVDRLREQYEGDPRYLALVLVGSVALGTETDASDIDHVLVVTDEEFERRKADARVHYHTAEWCDYPGGYVEGKTVNLQFLRDAAERGSEPTRFAFKGATVVFSRTPELASILARIPVYPEAERETKIRTFYAHMKVLMGYLSYALERNDAFLVARSASSVALYGARLALAHNRILYPYLKWFMREVRAAPAKPPGFDRLLDRLVREPTMAHANAFCQAIEQFMHLERYEEGWISRFVIDTEWNWLDARPPVEDW